jgi:hypothetical protein
MRILFLLAPLLVAAQDIISCNGCIGGTKKCIGDTSIQLLSDDDCVPCLKSSGKWTWPCNVEGLCWCWDSSKPKYKPALSSGLEPATIKPCDIFTEEMFNKIAPNAIHPYTYEGLCETIDMLNERYDEKIFMMGTQQQQKQEWAAFLGHTTHESAQYTSAREALVCARTTEKGGGLYCKPCDNENFDWENRYCEVSKVSNGQFYEDYCDKIITPPHGCVCGKLSHRCGGTFVRMSYLFSNVIMFIGPTTEVDQEVLAGLINPNFAYFGRGAIQLRYVSSQHYIHTS